VTEFIDDDRRELYQRWLASQEAADSGPATGPAPEADFDAWRAAQKAKRRAETVTIFGQQVAVPTSITLDLSLRIQEADTEDVELTQELVGELFGVDELERWRAAGCDVEEFAVLLAWGSACAQGDRITFTQAAALAEAARREEREGKAPSGNRAARRAASRKRKKKR
jgi:hypothetical protein